MKKRLLAAFVHFLVLIGIASILLALVSESHLLQNAQRAIEQTIALAGSMIVCAGEIVHLKMTSPKRKLHVCHTGLQKRIAFKIASWVILLGKSLRVQGCLSESVSTHPTLRRIMRRCSGSQRRVESGSPPNDVSSNIFIDWVLCLRYLACVQSFGTRATVRV